MDAIIYTSNTGTTAAYAQLLGESLGLPVYDLAAAKEVPAGGEIIYLGWLMASRVKGYKRVCRRYRVQAVCAVGMAAAGLQLEEVRKANDLADLPLFTLQGGLHLDKLRGLYKLLITVMVKTAGKGLAEKTDRTAEEDDMLDMLVHGGSRVTREALAPVEEWYHSFIAQ